MGHNHSHHHVSPEDGDGKIIFAIVVNGILTVAQIVGGIFSGSLALIADALHNLSDAISLVIAFAARKIGRKTPDADMTFGYARAEIVAALINYTTLIVIGLYLVYEGIMRLFSPSDTVGWLMVLIAGIALIVDLITAGLTYKMAKTSVNMRAAFLHNLSDALGSVAVIVAGVGIIVFGWTWIDPLVTLMIAGYILWLSFQEIGPVIRILMLGRPESTETDSVIKALSDIEGVQNVHHTQFWALDEHHAVLNAHIAIDEGAWDRADDIKARIKTMLEDKFHIHKSTLELECARHACADAPVIG